MAEEQYKLDEVLGVLFALMLAIAFASKIDGTFEGSVVGMLGMIIANQLYQNQQLNALRRRIV